MDPKKLQELREQLHEEACDRGDTTYIDPVSYYPVFYQGESPSAWELLHVRV